jgi:hypothetical protein
VSRNFFKDQIENLLKTTLLISYQQCTKKKKECAAEQEKKIQKRGLVIFHGNCLKNKKQV